MLKDSISFLYWGNLELINRCLKSARLIKILITYFRFLKFSLSCFAGDLGGSDVRDGVEREQTEPNELPNSPSSSGGFHQLSSNPLCSQAP